MNKRIIESLLAASLFVLTAFVPAAAQTYNYSVYIDSDNSASTGCNVVFPDGTISGAEVHLQATVNAGASPSVTTVTRETCSGGTFGAGTVIGGGYPVGLGNGVAGASVVELNDTLAAVQGGNTGAMRLYVVGTSDIGDDVLLSTNGALNGPPILFTPGAIQPSAPAQPIPTFGIPALLLLVGLVVFIGTRAARRRMRRFAAMLMLICGIAWAGTFVSDGQVGDWIGYSPIASDPAGDSTSGQAAIDLRAFFAATQAGNIFFRIDVANVNALSPPITVDDSYTASSGVTLNIAAPGVLSNDTVNSATISAHTAPTHGALTLNADGSFAYTPTTGYTGSDSFTYTLTNSGGTSTATVTFTVVAGPVAVADSYTTSVGTGLSISAPGVLNNDQLGAPPATMSSYGGGSLGGSVTDNTPGVAASGTLGGAALTLNADGSFVLGAPTTAGSYTFLYRIGNSQGTSDGIVTVQVNEAPLITSTNTTTFNVGSVSSFSITSTGTPNATIGESGTLPSGVIFTPGSGGTATLSGTPATGTSGSYPLTLTATNGISSPATQNFTLIITEGPAITSAITTTFTVGTAGTFTVTGSGAPTPTLSESGALPSGVTFTAATGVLSGTPAASTGGSYPITFTATNGIGSPATQNFTLIVDQAPAIISAATTTFTVGSAGTFSITTTGNPNAAISETGVLPSGVTLVDGGNGTATLSGTPAAGTGGSYPITINASNGIGTAATQNFTLAVDQAPTITSANATAFVVGASGSFTVTASGVPSPTLSESGALPTGVTFAPGTGILAGIPAIGTAGSYPITFTATNGIGVPATQTFTLQVNEAPAITSANTTTFNVGSVSSFNITSTGTPNATLGESGTLPSGVIFTPGGGGTATLSGTPAAGTSGSYPLTLTATNSIGSPATQNFTLVVTQGAAITSPSSTTFTVGTAGTFTVTGAGAPAPTLSESGALPSGVTFVAATGILSGTPAAGTGGSYPITFTATNGVGSPATQNFTLTIDQAPAITSLATTTFTVGTAGTFIVNATGNPNPAISKTGALPSGVTLTDNGNGTATLSGTPAAAAGGSYPLAITANNGIGSAATQNFTLVVNQAPTITSGSATAFVVGASGSFTVSATGTPSPTLSQTGVLPTGVTFVAATGVLSGTPAAGTAGSYPIIFTATNGVGSPATQAFTLSVNAAPAITSANTTTFNIGSVGSFSITSTGTPNATISESGALPSGVIFTPGGGGTATLSGTPAAGTSGSYPLTLTASNGVGSPATQNFTLVITQGAAITSANNTTFTVGTAGNFTVTGSGAPAPTLSESGTLPSGVTFVAATGILSGTPAAGTGGSYPITFTATNGVGSPATQNFTLTVNQAPAITSVATTTFTVGTAGTFAVTTTGNPSAAITETGTLPGGVILTDNGNGSATLAGTPAGGTGGSYPITISANNGVGSAATQSFTLVIKQAPAITSANTTTFTVGTAGSFTVTASGTPASTFSETGALPSGVTLNTSTGVLAGTPAATTGGSYSITLTAANGVTPNATQTFTLIVDQAPAIISANTTTFVVGTAGSFTINTTGYPNAVTSETGSLPSGVTLVDNGNGTATLAGIPAAGTAANYTLNLSATNSVGSPATQTFTLVVNQAPAITSVNTTTFTVGAAGTFTVTASGVPAPTLSISGTLPSGVTFTAATGVLAGTPAAGTGGTYSLTFTANNGVTPNAAQTFTLTVQQAPAITSANNTTFTVGTAGTFTVTANGVPVPTLSVTGTLPGGVTFTPATGVLAGTPAVASGGVYALTFTANNGVTPNATQTFTLTVKQAPAITSINTTTFTVGTAGSFTVTASGTPASTFSETGTLPSGVTLNPATGVLAGIPAAGMGGSYAITLTAANGVTPNATQTFTLIINQAPAITSANSTNFTIGSAGTFTVVASGYPGSSFSETGALPSGVTLSTAGLLSGTPAAGTAGSYPITISATNGVGSPATQSFTLVVLSPCVTITISGALANGLYQTAYSNPAFTQTGGTLPITWSATGLPAGLSINAATGVVSGTPTTTVAAANVTIGISDANTCPGSKALTGFKVAPIAGNNSYTTVGNTPLAVGNTLTTPYVTNATSLFSNDSGPGTLTTTAGTSATSGIGSVTLAANGNFTYTPPIGVTGTTDTFTYIVTDGNGVTSAPATVTITLAGKVWYVDGSAGTNGNGAAATPFNTLVSASSTHLAGDTIFVKSAGTATTTPGAISLKASSTLWGQGTSLPAIAGVAILNTSATSKPKLTGTVTLAGNNVTVSSLDINTSGATGFTNTGTTTGAVVQNSVTVTTANAVAVSLTNIAGTLNFLSVSASGAANGILLNNLSAGSFTVTGSGSAGSGGTISGITISGAAISVTNTTVATSFNYMALSSSAGNVIGVLATDALALTVANSTFSNFAVNGINAKTSTTSTSNGTFNIHDNTMNGTGADVIHLDFQGSGSFTGHVNSNTIGTAAVVGSGSPSGRGLYLLNDGTGTVTVQVDSNHIEQITQDNGIYFVTKTGTAALSKLNITATNNVVHMPTFTNGSDAMSVVANLAQAFVCLNATSNTLAAAGTSLPAVGISLEDSPAGANSTFQLQGYTGAGTDYTAVQNFLNGQNTLSGPGGGSIAESLHGTTTGFTNGTCPIAP
ncbi:hypothetical protein ELE36_17000 [Pseudolysobacter antarcticus]|uniref:Tandem-95 repeat protein n=1 Tax=Pseudolysobacter antarcticus TaxID=2511995 RepID=A0A411HN72_9GAMM|nr:putative Ig domain-containing protein [Pseudolysobacter antarcticus]QBB71920.1 hypothetical protein ELE36_17000 [Pseudolysobacter antarcticus]